MGENYRFKLLQDVDLRNKNLQDADFHCAVLDGVDFTGSDLRGGNFVGADFRSVSLTLDCKAFEGVRIDLATMYKLLWLISKLEVQNGNNLMSLLKAYIPLEEQQKLEHMFAREQQ